MVIQDNGNVGIGTTSPGEKLTVNGKIALIGGDALNWITTTGNQHLTLQSTGASGAIRFYTEDGGAGTEKVRIADNGNVGIGTTSPTAQLHVVRTSDVSATPQLAVETVSGDINNPRVLFKTTSDGRVLRVQSATARTDMAIMDVVNSVGTVFSIRGDGNVGIGTTSPGYKLTVNGTAWCSSGAWTGSDIRWKENVATLPNPLEKILRLRGVEFDWKREEFEDNNFPEGRQIGIIAQELETEFPELVTTNPEGYKGVAYDKLSVVLLEAIKEQQRQIHALRQDIEQL